ncbi:hypothetical protein [Gorillibacterium sp. sgz500922]|uniref:hypothetical protein n=1 Tax=Gorillibacterium sp. sgz500922 TaxID=3446694 RepID=UPI003F679DEB
MGESDLTERKLQLDCANYFRDHPHASETCEGLALLLGSRPEPLLLALGRLMELNILERAEDGPHTVYRYKLPTLTTRDDPPWTIT